MLKRRPVQRHCTKGCKYSDGLSDEMSKSTIALGAVMLSACGFTRKKRSHRGLISYLHRPTPRSKRPATQLGACRSYSYRFRTRSVEALSKVLLVREATSPVSPILSPR